MKRIFNDAEIRLFYDKFRLNEIFQEEIIPHLQLHHFEKDELVFRAGDCLDFYYFLVFGKIKIAYLFENGKVVILKVYTDFKTIGDLELLRDMPVKCNVEAVEESYLLGVPREIIKREYMENPMFLRHLVQSLSDKLFATMNNSSYNSIYPLINRLSSYLVEELNCNEKGNMEFQLKDSYEEIAEFLGTTYRHLNRTIHELEADGIIRVDAKKILVLQEVALRDYAKGEFV